MPYLITTTDTASSASRQHWIETGEHILSRRAVATLDEARDAALDVMWPHDYGQHERRFEVTAQIKRLPEQGGTIGPLPDGTVIEVERVEWEALISAGRDYPDIDAGYARREPLGVAGKQIIAAYNAAQED